MMSIPDYGEQSIGQTLPGTTVNQSEFEGIWLHDGFNNSNIVDVPVAEEEDTEVEYGVGGVKYVYLPIKFWSSN